MFVNVQTFFFDTCRNAESVNHVKSFEHYKAHSGSPAAYHDGTEQLRQQEVRTATVEEPLFGS